MFQSYTKSDVKRSEFVTYKGQHWTLHKFTGEAAFLIGEYRAYPLGWGSHPGKDLEEFPKSVQKQLMQTL